MLGRDLTLKGGNAFRKAYFPSTRFSDDLDYSSEHGYDPDPLLQQLNAVCVAAGDRSGVAFEIDRNVVATPPMQLDATRQVQKLRLYFRDFTGTTQEMVLKIRVDVTEFDRLALRVQERRLIHPYSDWRDCNKLIRVVKLEEALADKLRALMQRQHSHDLFDLVYGVFIDRSLDVNRIEIVRTFLRKSLFGQDAATPRSLLLALPFELMRRFWDRLVMPRDTRLGFDDALSRFRDGLVEFFAPFSVAEIRAAGYFPAEHRATIPHRGHRTHAVAARLRRGRPRRRALRLGVQTPPGPGGSRILLRLRPDRWPIRMSEHQVVLSREDPVTTEPRGAVRAALSGRADEGRSRLRRKLR
jgi:predicted nucleotidyltransferase component of viral defense system